MSTVNLVINYQEHKNSKIHTEICGGRGDYCPLFNTVRGTRMLLKKANPKCLLDLGIELKIFRIQIAKVSLSFFYCMQTAVVEDHE